MLGKMLIHGLVAATLIGSGAAVYAEVKESAPPAPAPAAVAASPVPVSIGNGYIQPTTVDAPRKEHRNGVQSERHRDRHHGKRGRDHDDDDD